MTLLTRFRPAITLSAGLCASLAATSALAHSPYLLPNGFTIDGQDHVTVEAAFSEHVFVPAIAMQSDGFQVVAPDGTASALKPVMLRDLAVLEVPTPADGTYRISSGERQGRVSKAAFIDGQWEFIDPRRPLPPGVTPVDMQSVTKAEAYVSRGTPTQTVLAPTGKGIEYRAVTHPDAIHAGKPAEFQILFDGKPLANADVEVEEARPGEVENVRLPLMTSDAQGIFHVTAPRPGLYHAMTRHRVAATAGEPARSYTYALTYSVSE
ncbi:putative GH25 family protein [Novosphingobium sp. PhB165]|uniref:DUF4198 domain-containing protein n=1 Tax=Novosphingobium sp. PhB165 TaxID=2485105 RepID=UPI0010EA2498|nr:DUF4198 domain-containing protein [Novosphingobium sp. PhB165]TCM15682.1 putative GH25 family protein [Novosphingobium sp. PhB165]